MLFFLLAPLSFLLQGAEPKAPDLQYRLRLEGESPAALWVDVHCQGTAAGRTQLHLATGWDSGAEAGSTMADLQASGARRRPLEVRRLQSDEVEVEHAPLERICVAYRLTERWPAARGTEEPEQRAFYLPLWQAGLFHSLGDGLFLRPRHLEDDAAHSIEFAWEGFEERGYEPVCSFGRGSGPFGVERDLESAVHTLFLASAGRQAGREGGREGGRARVLELDLPGGKLALWIHGEHWPFSDAEFAELARRVVLPTRNFFDDHQWPFYLISLLEIGRADAQRHSLGGTGLTQSFALFMHAGTPLEGPPGSGFSVAQLLFHEHFHNWNGMTLRLAQPEQQLYWLSEGWTNFYTRRLMLRGGFTSSAEYAADLSRTWERYLANPYRNADAARVEADFWNVREIGELPYQRGDLLAVWLDAQIRAASQGARDLDDLLREWVRAAKAGAPPLDLATLLAAVRAWTTPEVAQELERVVVGGADVPVELGLFEPCLEGRWVSKSTFELGFDFDHALQAKKIRGLRPDSAAARAGVLDGQTVLGLDVMQGDPTREVELVVEAPDGPRRLRFLPAGPERKVPGFVPRERASAEDCARL